MTDKLHPNFTSDDVNLNYFKYAPIQEWEFEFLKKSVNDHTRIPIADKKLN
jgi:hypothetical protein